jgi:hypothetical protein
MNLKMVKGEFEMSNHTPGPWRIAEGREVSDRKHRYIWSDAESREEREDDSPYCIATVHERTLCSQLDANARLIIAAPDLLQTLQAIAECDGDTIAGRCARETLAKAGL